jgi:Fur family iron response transcriptional regulator
VPEYNFVVIGSDSKLGAGRNGREVLCSVGISPTSRRVQIADLVFLCQQHVTAEEVYEQLNAESQPVSRATVYNTTLKILVDHGLLRQVTVGTSRVFYDSNISPHYHLFDTDTGELEDIEAEQFEILGMPEPPSGKSVAGVDVVVQAFQEFRIAPLLYPQAPRYRYRRDDNVERY